MTLILDAGPFYNLAAESGELFPVRTDLRT
jgi:hypothetical protein